MVIDKRLEKVHPKWFESKAVSGIFFVKWAEPFQNKGHVFLIGMYIIGKKVFISKRGPGLTTFRHRIAPQAEGGPAYSLK